MSAAVHDKLLDCHQRLWLWMTPEPQLTSVLTAYWSVNSAAKRVVDRAVEVTP